MRLKQILGGLTPAEKSALAALEASGRWAIMYDAKIEDGWKTDGQRSRTFQRQGRYELVLMRDTKNQHPATGLFDEPKLANEAPRFRPVPWVDEPEEKDSTPEPEPIEIFEKSELAKTVEPKIDPVAVSTKKKKRMK